MREALAPSHRRIVEVLESDTRADEEDSYAKDWTHLLGLDTLVADATETVPPET